MGTIVVHPRALAYHDYFPLWKVFLSSLGAELAVSPPISRAIVNEGVRLAVDGTCLPVKIFYAMSAGSFKPVWTASFAPADQCSP